MNISRTITYILLALVSVACTEVIEIDVEDAESQVVIEATLTNTSLNNQVILSQSASFYELGEYPRLSNATVSITDEEGNETLLIEQEAGIYSHPDLMGTSNQLYTLKVDLEGNLYTATSFLPNSIQIDSVAWEFRPASLFLEESTVPVVYFSSDQPASETYIRFTLIVNDTLLNGYSLYNGNLPRGESGTMRFFEQSFQPGDNIQVIAASIDRSVYDYYSQLAAITGNGMGPGGGASAAPPANPTSNLSNDALGYFGAMGLSTTVLVVP